MSQLLNYQCCPNHITTLIGSFHEDTELLKYFKCTLDTNCLVSEMIAQARLAVIQAVAKATSSNIQQLTTNKTTADLPLSQFGSSLKLSSATQMNIPPLQNSNHTVKSGNAMDPFRSLGQSSSVKLSSPTKDNSNSHDNNNNKRQRERSVTWDTSVTNLKSVFKKPKRMNSLKRSVKSFGKPNSSFFESAKNATFAEFGSLTKDPHVATFDPSGRLEVPKSHHLSTMNLNTRHTLTRNLVGAGLSRGNESVNATFDAITNNQNGGSSHSALSMATYSLASQNFIRKPTFTELARSAKYSQAPPQPLNGLLSFQALLSSGSTGSTSSNKQSLKRTPTQLENILLKQTQGKESGGNGGGNAAW